MKHLFVFFIFMLGNCCSLWGSVADENDTAFAFETELTCIKQPSTETANSQMLISACKHSPPKSHHCCGCNQVIFEADLSRCNIVEDDRCAFGQGADFVTAFNGNDFSCSKLRHKCGIEITPLNGTSFTFGIPPLGSSGPVPFGLFDHVKFLAYSLFREAPLSNCELCTTWVGSGKQLQVDNQPFDGAVNDPNSDPRLACFCFVALDPTLLTTFDWICTNRVIYALVERLPGAEAVFGDYAAYTYLIPVGVRNKEKDLFDDIHQFKTCYNREKGTVTWELDGCKVFQITQIGHRLTKHNAFVFKDGKKKRLNNPTRFQVLDHGGVDQDISPTGLQTGLAFFTLLDFLPAPTRLKACRQDITTTGLYSGLVRLESSLYRFGTTFFYNDPLQGGEQSFIEDSALVGTQYQPTIPSNFRLFGQGAALRLFKYKISHEKAD
ncbi:MAG: hypothetical protein H0U49_00085 [Parachlamydiaceae bacterium]|nr:hypothetical protein [Parachlamydiaceae bacterium]